MLHMAMTSFKISKNLGRIQLLVLVGWWIGMYVPVQGQTQFQLGAYGMPQVSFLLNEADLVPGKERLPLAGIQGGMWGRLVIAEHWLLQLRVAYAQGGGRWQHDGTDLRDSYKETVRLEQVIIPVMVGYRQPLKGSWGLSLLAGLQGAYLSRAYTYNDLQEFDPPIPVEFFEFPNTYATYEPWHISATGLLELEVLVADPWRFHLFVQGAYGIGDAEDKSVAFLVKQGQGYAPASYWTWKRGTPDAGATRALSLGWGMGFSVNL